MLFDILFGDSRVSNSYSIYFTLKSTVKKCIIVQHIQMCTYILSANTE